VDLIGTAPVLFAGPDAGAWERAASAAADRLGVPLDTHRVGVEVGDFGRAYGIGPAGAVLVRPDGYIAWRAVDAGDGAEVDAALTRMLCRG
jgi:hypothetical protein